jgi:hypothetical protein
LGAFDSMKLFIFVAAFHYWLVKRFEVGGWFPGLFFLPETKNPGEG